MEPLNIADITELVRCAHHNIIKDQRHILATIIDSETKGVYFLKILIRALMGSFGA